MNKILEQDYFRIVNAHANLLGALSGSTLLITGATGLIGTYLVHLLAYANANLNLRLKMLLPVRNPQKAQETFSDIAPETATIYERDITHPLADLPPADFAIHGAAPTNSRFFIEHPVDTILSNVLGTRHILDWASSNPSAKLTYLSTMETYGEVQESPVDESTRGLVDPMSTRSSYPESKRLCETLCLAYSRQYGIHASVARLTQCIGPGARQDDARAAIQFAASVFKGRDITLHTTGASARNYCYLSDAATGILTILTRGKDGEAYNIASDNSYISIRDLADRIIHRHPASHSTLNIVADPSCAKQYAQENHINLSTKKLQRLGWKSEYSLDEAIDRTMLSWETP